MRFVLLAVLALVSCRDDAACKLAADRALAAFPTDVHRAADQLSQAKEHCREEPRYKHAAALVDRTIAARKAETEARTAELKKAWFAAETFVENNLKAPGSAKFSDGTANIGNHVRDLGGGRYAVSGWVDSENAFGALLRADFVVYVRRDGTDWVLDEPVKLVQR